MKTTHTPEPEAVDANAARIVACVNACAGIPEPVGLAVTELIRGCHAALAYLAEPRSKHRSNRKAAEEIIRGALRRAGSI